MDKKQQRLEIIKLYLAKNSNRLISKRLKIPRTTVNETIIRYNERGDFSDRKRMRKSSVATLRVLEMLRERIRRNPRRSMRKVAKDIGISRETVR